MSQIAVNKGIFKNLQDFHEKKRVKVCNSRQAKSYRLKNLAKTARLLSTQNGVSIIIYYYVENEKGPNSVSGMAFGEKAEKILASPKAVEFSRHFRKSFSVEEKMMCNLEEEITLTGKQTSVADNESTKHLNNTEKTCSTEVLKQITNIDITEDQSTGKNLASQKAIEYSLQRKHYSEEEMTFDLEPGEEISLPDKRSSAAGDERKKDLKNTGLTCSASCSLIVAQLSRNQENEEQMSSQVEILKQKRQPKLLRCKAKPKNQKKISKAHAAMENKPSELTPVTENVLTTQTENEGFFEMENTDLKKGAIAVKSSEYWVNDEQTSSQIDFLVLKQKGQPKEKELLGFKTKPNGKKNKKAHEVTDNKPAESTSCDDGVSQTENLLATQTEIEGFFEMERTGLIEMVAVESSDSESEMRGQSRVRLSVNKHSKCNSRKAIGISQNVSDTKIYEKKDEKVASNFPNQKRFKLV